jgi:hypothetical protein
MDATTMKEFTTAGTSPVAEFPLTHSQADLECMTKHMKMHVPSEPPAPKKRKQAFDDEETIVGDCGDEIEDRLGHSVLDLTPPGSPRRVDTAEEIKRNARVLALARKKASAARATAGALKYISNGAVIRVRVRVRVRTSTNLDIGHSVSSSLDLTPPGSPRVDARVLALAQEKASAARAAAEALKHISNGAVIQGEGEDEDEADADADARCSATLPESTTRRNSRSSGETSTTPTRTPSTE